LSRCEKLMTTTPDVVSIEYEDLVQFDPTTTAGEQLMERIGVEAFGPDGLGIVAVRHVPDFAVKRLALLPLAAQLPTLPDIDSCVDASSLYSIGWSHGKEALGPSGQRDVSKGSYYVNPFAATPVDDDNDDTATIIKNVWPASLPQLRPAVLEMADLLQHVGCLVAKVCDAYCQSKQQTVGTSRTRSSSSSIEQAIRTSRAAKARLLHYFAAPTVRDNNDGAATTTMNDDEYSWCAWHNDHVRREALTYSVASVLTYIIIHTGLSDRPRAWNVHARRTRDSG
jgi:hypothetical protein